MADQPRFVRVFLSSPGDVADERSIARKVIEDAAGQAPFRDQVVARTIAWDNLSSRTPMRGMVISSTRCGAFSDLIIPRYVSAAARRPPSRQSKRRGARGGYDGSDSVATVEGESPRS